MSDVRQRRIWAVLPAAGVGRRMSSRIPKQYLTLLGRPVIGWSLETVLADPRVGGAVVAVGADDGWWADEEFRLPKPVHRVDGGEQRADSVLSALRYLAGGVAGEDDWVLVHDAVRPCLTAGELRRLLDAGLDHDGGALLAVPVRDTLKRSGPGAVVASTASRDQLWQAQTPQLFPLRPLLAALEAARGAGDVVTDEAQAMERAGFAPLLVEGESTNLKITRPGDLPLAESILRARRAEQGEE